VDLDEILGVDSICSGNKSIEF